MRVIQEEDGGGGRAPVVLLQVLFQLPLPCFNGYGLTIYKFGGIVCPATRYFRIVHRSCPNPAVFKIC